MTQDLRAAVGLFAEKAHGTCRISLGSPYPWPD